MSSKRIRVANFNITFDPDRSPMLDHFEDAIYPALRSQYRRNEKNAVYYFDDIRLKVINGRFALSGMLIKDTEYNIKTVVKNGRLVNESHRVPTAPYSRFVVMLDSHRMALVQNEGYSPDIRSFQATLRGALSTCRSKTNKARSNQPDCTRVPKADVNVIEMTRRGEIHQILEDFDRISELKLRFFPLNGDFDNNDFLEMMRSSLGKLGTTRGHFRATSPENVSEVEDLTEDAMRMGTVAATISGKGKSGENLVYSDSKIKSTHYIVLEGNVGADDDGYIINEAVSQGFDLGASGSNLELYGRTVALLQGLLDRQEHQ